MGYKPLYLISQKFSSLLQMFVEYIEKKYDVKSIVACVVSPAPPQ